MGSTLPTDAPTPRATIQPLNGLRGLAAVWLVLFHLRQPLLPTLPASRLHSAVEAVPREGFLGVDFFFMLSGFILCYTYAGRMTRPSWSDYRAFAWRRFARTYPVYLLSVLIVLAVTALLA